MKSFKHNTKRLAEFKINKTNSSITARAYKATFCLAGILAISTMLVNTLHSASADDAANVDFQVNVKETLAVAVTTPTDWANGDTGDFLRNKVSVDVNTNNGSNFTASMYSQDSTNLTNTSRNTETLPTLTSSSTRSNFPANYWGYSLGAGTISGNTRTYGETDAGNTSSNYYPLVSTSNSPITILTGTNTGSQDIYFGAKANTDQAAGTYAGTVIISVVTGVIDNTTNPVTPANPATPAKTEEVATYNPAPTGSASNGSTTYTYTRRSAPSGGTGSATTTTTTQVSDGDNRSAYQGYQAPQGVVEDTIMDVKNSSTLAAGLATTASVAAATGMFFFILAKRKEDDEEEEEEYI